MKLYFDTSVLVASAVKGHVHHAPAHSALERLLRDKNRGYVSAHGLAEIYAVLTRAPFVPPVYPSEAWQILEQNILPHFTLVELASKDYVRLVKACAAQGWKGGRVYDLLHLACAQRASFERIYTFNFLPIRVVSWSRFRRSIIYATVSCSCYVKLL